MKRRLLTLVSASLVCNFFFYVCAACAFGQDNDSSPVLRADRVFARAFAKPDRSALKQLLDGEFTWIDANGKSLTGAEVIESLPKLENADVEPQIRLYGSTGLVRASHDRLHTLRIWVHHETGWRILLYQEVQQVEKSEPPARQAPSECENPCKSIPFTPDTQSEKDAIVSWQGVMRAMANNDADAYAPLIADEFTATDTHHDRPYSKADRLAQIKKQQFAGTRSAPPVLISARMFDFGETVTMIAREQRANARPYFNTRMWVRRGGRWQMLFSFNTRIAG